MLADISDGKATVFSNGLREYVDKILYYVNQDMKCLNKIHPYKFYQQEFIEEILVRNIIVKYNKVNVSGEEEVDQETEQELIKISQEYNDIKAIIDRKKSELKKEYITDKKEPEQNEDEE